MTRGRTWLAVLALLALPAQAGGPVDTSLTESFFEVIQTGDPAEAMAMLKQGPDLAFLPDSMGYHAMNMLESRFDPRVFAALLAHGADVNAATPDGITLLHTVNDPGALPLLLDAGADLEARSAEGYTPLMTHLMEPEGAGMVETLLKAGANPNVQSADGLTPLAIAADGDGKTTRLLIRYGARP